MLRANGFRPLSGVHSVATSHETHQTFSRTGRGKGQACCVVDGRSIEESDLDCVGKLLRREGRGLCEGLRICGEREMERDDG